MESNRIIFRITLFFSQSNTLEIHLRLHISMVHTFLLMTSISQYEYSTVSLTIHILKNI